MKDLVAAASATKLRVNTDDAHAGQPSAHAKPKAQPIAATWADGIQPNSDVEWHSWKEGQSYEENHRSAMERAAELKSYLAIRKGGGSNLGIITDQLLLRDGHWEVFGLQRHSGPNSATSI